MKKSQIKSKLDETLYYTTKQYIIEIGIIDKSSGDNKKQDDAFGNEIFFELSNTQSYTNSTELTYL